MGCSLDKSVAEELIVAYAARTLSADAQADLERHLETCSSCRELAEQQRAVWSLLEEWHPLPVSPDFDQKMAHRVVHAGRNGWWRGHFGSWSWRPLIPIAAACTVLVFAFLLKDDDHANAPGPASQPQCASSNRWNTRSTTWICSSRSAWMFPARSRAHRERSRRTMFPRGPILALAALGCGLFLGAPALAQRGARGARTPRGTRTEAGQKQKTPIDEFETMSPAEQQKALNRLPTAQRRQLQERLRRFNALPPEQQQTLKTLYNHLHQLPPQRQEAVRKAINKFSQQAPDRQQAMREELRSAAALPPQERQAHMSSPDFRARFNNKEQDILHDMSPLLGWR